MFHEGKSSNQVAFVLTVEHKIFAATLYASLCCHHQYLLGCNNLAQCLSINTSSFDTKEYNKMHASHPPTHLELRVQYSQQESHQPSQHSSAANELRRSTACKGGHSRLRRGSGVSGNQNEVGACKTRGVAAVDDNGAISEERVDASDGACIEVKVALDNIRMMAYLSGYTYTEIRSRGTYLVWNGLAVMFPCLPAKSPT